MATEEIATAVLFEKITGLSARIDDRFATATDQLGAIERHVDARFDALRALLDERFDTQKNALIKAEEANNERLESMNQFRAQINEERSTYATRDQVEQMMQTIRAEIEPLKKQNQFSQGERQRGNEKGDDNRSWIAIGISVLVAVIMAAALWMGRNVL